MQGIRTRIPKKRYHKISLTIPIMVAIFTMAIFLASLTTAQATVPTGTISGRVTYGTSTAPVVEAIVEIYTISGSRVAVAYTDDDGYYLTGGLAEGSYKVKFFTTSKWWPIPQYYNDKPDWASADIVTVTGGSVTAGINGHMYREIECGRPALSLGMWSPPYWSSYANYEARKLSVVYVISNNTAPYAPVVKITGTENTNGVNLATSIPLVIPGTDEIHTLTGANLLYDIPAGVTSFHSTIRVTAQDRCAATYTYPS